MSLLDRHTLLGERLYQWTVPIAAATAALWLSLERQRMRAQRRWLFIALHILHHGATVEIGVRRGALDIPWVDEVRLRK